MTTAGMKLKLVETEPRSLFEDLWRLFPQMKNATCVGQVSWASRDRGCGSLLTFRTLAGEYVRIRRSEEGNKVEPVSNNEIEIYEDAWQQLGSRAIEYGPTDRGHAIMFASNEFVSLTEELILFGDD